MSAKVSAAHASAVAWAAPLCPRLGAKALARAGVGLAGPHLRGDAARGPEICRA
jgi:hypothetical protein